MKYLLIFMMVLFSQSHLLSLNFTINYLSIYIKGIACCFKYVAFNKIIKLLFLNLLYSYYILFYMCKKIRYIFKARGAFITNKVFINIKYKIGEVI